MSPDPQEGTAAPDGVSWWLHHVGLTAPTRPPVDGDLDVDVAILGAGFTGLWTALCLLRRAPDLRVVIVEAEHVGFGASGRNGGWCSAGLSVTWGELARRHGFAMARTTAQAMRDTVGALAADCAAESIDAHIRPGGILRIARGDHEVAALDAGWRTLVDLGLDEGCERLSSAALAERVTVADARGAMFDAHGLTVHPGRLVTGLAAAVERRGGVVHEGTLVTAVRPGVTGRRPVLVTTGGTVTADTVVLAGEAFMAGLAPVGRRVLPVYSLIVMTEPLTDAQWEGIGWAGGECLSSHRHTVDYLSRTDDGRILFGGRGAPYHYGSGIDPAFDLHTPTHDGLEAQMLEWFPSLAGIGFSGRWGGAVALSRDWLPTIAHDPVTGVAGAYGYGGQGVATAHLAGQVLAARIAGAPLPEGLTDLPLLDHVPRRWEPEPVRWLAVRYLQGALARLDARAARTGRAPTGRSPAERLTRH